MELSGIHPYVSLSHRAAACCCCSFAAVAQLAGDIDCMVHSSAACAERMWVVPHTLSAYVLVEQTCL